MKKILLVFVIGLTFIIFGCQQNINTSKLVTESTNITMDNFTDFNDDTEVITRPHEATTEYISYNDNNIGYNIEEYELMFPLNIKTEFEYEITGMFEGKNIITIMLESGVSAAVDPVLTPTLYQMTQEGIYFPNHYTENKTYMSEIIGILGNYPSDNFITSRYNYELPFSLPNVFNYRGYRTAYFHENLGSFFWRDQKIPVLGFEEDYYHTDFFPEEPIYGWGGDYTLDSRTMEAMSEYMFTEEDDQPFYYFWTSLVTHGPYNKNYSSKRGINNLEKFTNLGYFEKIDKAAEEGEWTNPLESLSDKEKARFRYYQAAMMDFDIALKNLLTMLEEESLLDDTLIIIYGDHSFYHDDIHKSLLEATNPDAHEKEMYKTFFTIYNPELTSIYNQYYDSTTNEKFITPFDIIPTINQLFNIPYYKELTQGHSVFLEEESIFYSHKLNQYFNDEFYSINGKDIEYPIYKNINDHEEAEEFIRRIKDFKTKQDHIDDWVYSRSTKK